MKSFIIAFILALLFSCLTGSSGGPPQPTPIGVNGNYSASDQGVKKEDFQIGDSMIVDGTNPKATGLMNKVVDVSSMQKRSDYPNMTIFGN